LKKKKKKIEKDLKRRSSLPSSELEE